MQKDPDSILVFTDGACSGNPGRGGWGAVIVLPQGEVIELGGGAEQTTNNRMELAGTIHSLNKLRATKGPIDLWTDSVYVIRGITQWVFGWKKRGWKTAEGNDVANKDLWQVLLEEVTSRKIGEQKINWYFVKGHAGVPGNERCDEIAVAFSKGRSAKLYSGSLLKYDVAIHDVPESGALPEPKPKQEKKAPAYSYVSLINGQVQRHSNWADCEKRVKGVSGARFKKAMTEEEEGEILASWGVSL